MTERYILVSDDEYVYTLDTMADNYNPLEDFEKKLFENAKKEGIDIQEYEDAILEEASDKYWEWVYNNYIEAEAVNDMLNTLSEENEKLKCGNQNMKSVLNDFINMCNKLQANPEDISLQSKAREMLIMMGIEVEE